MRTKDELTREVEARNKLRAEVGLPLVPVAEEVKKLQKAELWQDYGTWADRNPDLLARIVAEELERERRERYDPTWELRALLNGAGAFGSKVQVGTAFHRRLRSVSRAQHDAVSMQQTTIGAGIPGK